MNSKNFTKYLTFAFITFTILRYVPQFKIDDVEQIILSCLISSLFVIIDTITPCIVVDKSKCIRQEQDEDEKEEKEAKKKKK